MNVGQILETMLGWAAKQLNVQMIPPSLTAPRKNRLSRWFASQGKAPAGRCPEEFLPSTIANSPFTTAHGREVDEKITVGICM